MRITRREVELLKPIVRSYISENRIGADTKQVVELKKYQKLLDKLECKWKENDR